jgi:hypothetical protein
MPRPLAEDSRAWPEEDSPRRSKALIPSPLSKNILTWDLDHRKLQRLHIGHLVRRDAISD